MPSSSLDLSSLTEFEWGIFAREYPDEPIGTKIPPIRPVAPVEPIREGRSIRDEERIGITNFFRPEVSIYSLFSLKRSKGSTDGEKTVGQLEIQVSNISFSLLKNPESSIPLPFLSGAISKESIV